MSSSPIAAGLGAATLLAAALLTATAGPAAADDQPDPQRHTDADCRTQAVTPKHPAGWAPLDGTTPEFVDGPAGAPGRGSLRFTVQLPADKVDFYHATSTPLSQATHLGYVQNTTGAAQASYELKILNAKRTDGTASGFTTLVWEPYRNGQPLGTTNGWVRESDIEQGHWWSTRSIAGATGGQSEDVSLAAVAAANPDAVVTAYGVNLGRNNAVSTSFVDDVEFRCQTANFEPTPGHDPNGRDDSAGGTDD